MRWRTTCGSKTLSTETWQIRIALIPSPCTCKCDQLACIVPKLFLWSMWLRYLAIYAIQAWQCVARIATATRDVKNLNNFHSPESASLRSLLGLTVLGEVGGLSVRCLLMPRLRRFSSKNDSDVVSTYYCISMSHDAPTESFLQFLPGPAMYRSRG